MSHARLDAIFSGEDSLQVIHNRLCIDGTPIVDLLESDKPHYLYSKQMIQERIQVLRAALPSDIHLHYAVKANPMPDLVAYIAPFVDGLDVASGQELSLVSPFCQPEQVSFAGPAKQLDELHLAIEQGVVINVESPTELARIHTIAETLGKKALIAFRVNPDFELKQAGMQMSGGAKPFGIDAETIVDVAKTINESVVTLVGLHIFAGSQNLSADALITAHEQTFLLAQRLVNELDAIGFGDSLRHVNIGGGFGIPYFPKQPALDITPVCAALTLRLSERTGRFSELSIVMELGRYIVGEAGLYVCQVTDYKHSRGVDYLMVNGGMHHHLANSGNFGQVIRKNYPVLLADNVLGDELHPYEIAGPLCTPLDIVAAKVHLPKANIGDAVVVLQSGAYGYTASPLAFLSHPEPIERLV